MMVWDFSPSPHLFLLVLLPDRQMVDIMDRSEIRYHFKNMEQNGENLIISSNKSNDPSEYALKVKLNL